MKHAIFPGKYHQNHGFVHGYLSLHEHNFITIENLQTKHALLSR